jgi:hypothetical protein
MNLKQALLGALEGEQLKELCAEFEIEADRRSGEAMVGALSSSKRANVGCSNCARTARSCTTVILTIIVSGPRALRTRAVSSSPQASRPAEARLFASNPLTAGGYRKNQSLKFVYQGREFDPGIERGSCWKHTVRTDDGSVPGMERLARAGRLYVARNQLRFKRYVDDFPFKLIDQSLGWLRRRVGADLRCTD